MDYESGIIIYNTPDGRSKEMLDDIHKRKIDYALAHGKTVEYLEKP